MTLPPVSYKRHRFPPEIIAHTVWLYFRFPLSLRLVEEMLLERGVLVSYETVRRWALKFGQAYVRRLKRKRPSRGDIWHTRPENHDEALRRPRKGGDVTPAIPSPGRPLGDLVDRSKAVPPHFVPHVKALDPVCFEIVARGSP
jgi:hypothetical protein